MYALDFEYAGKLLSDYGFIICDFNGSKGAVTADPGSKITFNTVSMNRGRHHSLASTLYDSCIEAEFDICKDPDINEERYISKEESRRIMRWLNRECFMRFRAIDYENDTEPCYFNASFNVHKITVADRLCGFHLEMTTDKPFGYGAEKKHKLSYAGASSSIAVSQTVIEQSDCLGETYPKLIITCKASGNLTLTNRFLDSSNSIVERTMYISDCSNGEVITIDGIAKIITTNSSTHDIYNCFNYVFLSLGNSDYGRKNTISSTLDCDIALSYSPTIKDIPQ